MKKLFFEQNRLGLVKTYRLEFARFIHLREKVSSFRNARASKKNQVSLHRN
jgi:hypothetical protein